MTLKNKKVISCHSCGTKKAIPNKEYRRKKRKGTRFFCSLSCAACGKRGSVENQIYTEDKNLYYTLIQALRITKKNAKRKRIFFDIDIEYLYKLYRKQHGLCALSKVKMAHRGPGVKKDTIRQLSIDRIDSNKGYTDNNVQLLCLAMNRMKNSSSNEDIIIFIQEADFD